MQIGLIALLLLAIAGSGQSLIAQPDAGTVLWTYDAGAVISTSPAVTGRVVYVGTTFGFQAVTNLGASGSNLWTYAAPVTGSPSIAADGTIYFGDGSSNVNLNALNPDGSRKWSLPIQLQYQYAIGFRSTPAIAPDKTVCFTAGADLWAVSPSGAIKWQQHTDDSTGSWVSPVLGSDDTIYIGSTVNRTFYSFRSDGTPAWSVGLHQGIGDSSAIGRDGTLYVTGGPLYAFSANGTNLWSLSPFGVQFDGAPAIAADGTILVSGKGTHTLYAVTPAGEVAWQGLASPSKVPATTPAIDAGGTIYFCVSNSVVALNAKGQVQWSVYAGVGFQGYTLAATSPVIAPEGTLYAALGNKLYAIATGTNGPADSPWPMYQQNARHTGRIEKPSLHKPGKRSDANFEFQVNAQVGKPVTVENSTNLITWNALTSFVPTEASSPVVDLTASNAPAKFYRAFSKP